MAILLANFWNICLNLVQCALNSNFKKSVTQFSPPTMSPYCLKISERLVKPFRNCVQIENAISRTLKIPGKSGNDSKFRKFLITYNINKNLSRRDRGNSLIPNHVLKYISWDYILYRLYTSALFQTITVCSWFVNLNIFEKFPGNSLTNFKEKREVKIGKFSSNPGRELPVWVLYVQSIPFSKSGFRAATLSR